MDKAEDVTVAVAGTMEEDAMLRRQCYLNEQEGMTVIVAAVAAVVAARRMAFDLEEQAIDSYVIFYW